MSNKFFLFLLLFFLLYYNKNSCNDSCKSLYYQIIWFILICLGTLLIENIFASLNKNIDMLGKFRSCFYVTCGMLFLYLLFNSFFTYYSQSNDCYENAVLVDYTIRLVIYFIYSSFYLIPFMCILVLAAWKVVTD